LRFSFRPGTNDILIYEALYKNNEYRLPPTFAPSDLIVDVGAHVGIFSSLALERGAGTVYAVEAHPENYQMAVQHLKTELEQGRVDLRWGAVWRSDERRTVLYHSGYKRGFDHPHQGIEINTGAGHVFGQIGKEVPVISFDTLLWEATLQGTRRVRFLKLDCEGAEWPIIYTSQLLHLIDEIAGEFHEIGGMYASLNPLLLSLPYDQFTVVELEKYLSEHHFAFSHNRATRNDGTPAPRGMFFAKKIS
jgi:FkbM family methyltransferase